MFAYFKKMAARKTMRRICKRLGITKERFAFYEMIYSGRSLEYCQQVLGVEKPETEEHFIHSREAL